VAELGIYLSRGEIKIIKYNENASSIVVVDIGRVKTRTNQSINKIVCL